MPGSSRKRNSSYIVAGTHAQYALELCTEKIPITYRLRMNRRTYLVHFEVLDRRQWLEICVATCASVMNILTSGISRFASLTITRSVYWGGLFLDLGEACSLHLS